MELAGVLDALRRAWRRVDALHDEYFVGRWRAGLRRAARRQEDTFMALVCLDALGIDNPASWYLLEAYPELAERFHQGHLAAGLARFPEPDVCC